MRDGSGDEISMDAQISMDTLDNDIEIVKYGIKYICEFCISTYNSWYWNSAAVFF